ncbi:MAG TPA: hypothetical protein VGH42_08820 [Verrucomicrobiae bacterium]|jgi:hypothetical protein
MNFLKFFKLQKNRKFTCGALIIIALAGSWKIAHVKFDGGIFHQQNIFTKANSGTQIINNGGKIGAIIFESAKMTDEGRENLAIGQKAKEPAPVSNEQPKEEAVSCSFTYLQSDENVPQLDQAQLSLTARNPVARIYNKVARQAQLQRELDGLSPIPLIQLRPTSMHLQCPSNISEENALRTIERDLDNNLARLDKMLADNPFDGKLAYAH